MPESADRPTALGTPRFISRIDAVRATLRRRRFARLTISAFGLTAAVFLGVDGLDRLHSLQESTAFGLVLAGIVAVLGFWGFTFLRALLHPVRSPELALVVERTWSGLMDAFVCAVELYEKKVRHSRDLTPLERLVLTRAETASADLPIEQEVIPAGLGRRRLISRAVLFAVLAVVGMHGTGPRKAYRYFMEHFAGGPPGLMVQPGDIEVPEGDDVVVHAEIRRWQRQAGIWFRDADGSHRLSMTPERNGRGLRFSFYGVTGRVRYRVITPSLASRTFRITTYRPPALRSARIRIKPPDYTGRPARNLDELQDIAAVVGSRIRFRFRAVRTETAVLSWVGAEKPLVADGDDAYTADVTLSGSGKYAVRLRDAAGHTYRTPWFQATAIPDQPPVIEVLQPHRDVDSTIKGTVPLLARAVDDFGLDEINLIWSVSGGARRTEHVFAAGSGSPPAKPGGVMRERDASYAFDLARLGVKEGDVIAYFFTARDNRRPNPQEARSQVYFIEVRPNLNSVKQKGGGGKKKNLDITPLIAESKRLIRASWDAQALPEKERIAAVRSLASAMHDLRVSASRVFQKMRGRGGRDLVSLADAALERIRTAGQLLESGLVEESIPSQEQALARLVALENQLMKNAMAQSGNGGKGKSTQSKDGKKNRRKEGDRRQGLTQAAKLRVLRKSAEELRRLAAEQTRLNERMRRTLPDGAPALAGPQQGTGNDTERVTRTLGAVPEAAAAAADAGMAAKEMAEAAKTLAAGDPSAGLRNGLRARVRLDAAIREVEAAYKQIAAGEVQRLARAAADLSKRERAAARASGQMQGKRLDPGSPELQAMTGQQRNIHEQTRRLLQAADQAAAAIEGAAPKAAQAVSAAVAAARKAGLEARQKRAGNALRYQRFNRAAQYQTEAANRLLQLSGDLHKAAGLLPGMTPSEVRAVLRAVRKAALDTYRAAQQGGRGAMKTIREIRGRTADALGRAGTALHDNTLQDMAGDLSLPVDGDKPDEAGRRTIRLLNAAAAILEKHLALGRLRARASLYRDAAVAPEKYRRLVEEYFRDLSESQ